MNRFQPPPVLKDQFVDMQNERQCRFDERDLSLRHAGKLLNISRQTRQEKPRHPAMLANAFDFVAVLAKKIPELAGRFRQRHIYRFNKAARCHDGCFGRVGGPFGRPRRCGPGRPGPIGGGVSGIRRRAGGPVQRCNTSGKHPRRAGDKSADRDFVEHRGHRGAAVR